MPITSGKFTVGGNADIDTTAEQLKNSNVPCVFGVRVKAVAGNAGIVYVGPKGVTADTADATDGYPLAAGEEVLIPIDNLNKVYVIASQVDQKARFLAA